MAVFRRNAMQHVRFFHEFLFQTVSYAKVPDRDGNLPKYPLSTHFIKRVRPLFAQLCDPYTSYNQGQYGVTLKQFCFQSYLFFGKQAPYFAQRIYHYLIRQQHKTFLMMQGGEHRFKKIMTPQDHIQYQAFIDFCFDVTRPNMKVPFDKREIEFFMFDFGERL